MPVRILIADDHEVVRQGVRKILAARPEWEICGEALNGQEAIRMAGELRPDVIVMDITMPAMSGLEATRKLSSDRNSPPILIFTMHESRSLAESVKEVGARGFVFKSRAARDLIKALEALLKGGTFFSPDGESTPPAKDDPKSGISFLQALDPLRIFVFA